MARPVRPRHAIVLAACAALVAGCGGGQSPLSPQSRASRDIATLWWWMLAIACVMFAGALAMLGIAWVRRRREGLPVVGGGGGKTMGLVIASIHERRDEFRAVLKKSDEERDPGRTEFRARRTVGKTAS